ncbi:MAG: DMT family transporter [Cloacibacillus sp.]
MIYGIFLSLLTCLCWGSTSFLLRGINRLDASEMSFMRASGGLLCGLFLLIFSHAGLSQSLKLSDILVFIALVLCNNVIGDVFLFFALHRLGVARGAAISSSYPIPVALASSLFFGAKLSFPVVAGTVAVVAAVALLCHSKKSEGGLSVSGLVYAVLACLFWAAGLLFNKQLVVAGLAPITIVLGRGVAFFTIAFAIWLARLAFVKNDMSSWRRLRSKEALMGLLAGILSLGFGAWLYSSALEYVAPAVATTIGGANPIVATVFALVIYKEKVRPLQWAAIALAAGGSVLVTF